MKTATLKELKAELNLLIPLELINICIHLSKYKKENKELLSYLLFESSNELEYVKSVKNHLDEQFEDVNKNNLYLTKKMLRKILKTTNKYIKYSDSKKTEVELLIHFCKKTKSLGIRLPENTALGNLYLRQIQKIRKVLATLHEDLQYDYAEEIKAL